MQAGRTELIELRPNSTTLTSTPTPTSSRGSPREDPRQPARHAYIVARILARCRCRYRCRRMRPLPVYTTIGVVHGLPNNACHVTQFQPYSGSRLLLYFVIRTHPFQHTYALAHLFAAVTFSASELVPFSSLGPFLGAMAVTSVTRCRCRCRCRRCRR